MEQVSKGWNTLEIVTTESWISLYSNCHVWSNAWKLCFVDISLTSSFGGVNLLKRIQMTYHLEDDWSCRKKTSTWNKAMIICNEDQPQLSGEKTFFKNYRHPEIRIYDFPKHANQYSIYPTHLQLTEVLTPTLTPSMVGRNRPTRKCHTSRAVFVTSWTSSHTQKVRKLWILTNRLYHDWLVGGFNPIEKF